MEVDYSGSGDLIIEITNSLNEDAGNESVGISNVDIVLADAGASGACPSEEGYVVPVVCTVEADAGDFDHNGCVGWTKKECGEYSMWGGARECG
jgi:hypothetical protein